MPSNAITIVSVLPAAGPALAHPEAGIGPAAPAAARPRVWTALLAAPGALGLGIAIQTMVFIIAVVILGPGSVGGASDAAMTPGVILLAVVAGQVGFGLFPLMAAGRSAVPWRQRLGLVKGRMGLAWLPVLMLGTIFVQMLLGVAMRTLFGEPSEHLKELAAMLSAGTGLLGVAIVLASSVLPGVCEELLCRGYIQSRLVARWGPAAGIGLTSVIFGLMHVDPMHALVAMVLGAWCGIVAWRSGSVWPAMACHFFNNFVGVMAVRWCGIDSWEPRTPGGLMEWVFVGLPAIAFVIAVVGLVRCGRGDAAADAAPVATVAA